MCTLPNPPNPKFCNSLTRSNVDARCFVHIHSRCVRQIFLSIQQFKHKCFSNVDARCLVHVSPSLCDLCSQNKCVNVPEASSKSVLNGSGGALLLSKMVPIHNRAAIQRHAQIPRKPPKVQRRPSKHDPPPICPSVLPEHKRPANTNLAQGRTYPRTYPRLYAKA